MITAKEMSLKFQKSSPLTAVRMNPQEKRPKPRIKSQKARVRGKKNKEILKIINFKDFRILPKILRKYFPD